MLGEFTIERTKVRQCYGEIEVIENTLEEIRTRIRNVSDHLTVSGKGTSELKSCLKEESTQLKKLIRTTHEMKEALEEVVRIYGATEAKLSGSREGIKIFGEKVEDFFSDLVNKIEDSFEDWNEKVKENSKNVVSRIKDKDTREGFSEAYQATLQQVYEDVPVEYQDAKTLYDKYSNDVVVEEFNTVDKNGNSSPYHSNGKLYLNTNADLNNKRGDGTTYYHEYGHFVVYKEGWVNGNKCTGPMKEFEESLRKEITQYYESYETQFKQEGMAKGYTNMQLEKYVESQTTAAIKQEINGGSQEYYDVNNGLSDIIDGVSNGKYQPSYGHGDGYWDANQSRVANEAFAQLFSAQMTGDTVEIGKMKELMPETYEIYCSMIQDTAK